MFTQPQFESVCRLLAEETTGSQITRMLEALRYPCDSPENATKWKRIFNAIALDQRKSHSFDSLKRIVEWIMQPC